MTNQDLCLTQAKDLWHRVLMSGYLEDDVYDRDISKINPLIPEIISFLKKENVSYQDKPNSCRSIVLLTTLLSETSLKKQNSDLLSFFLKLGLLFDDFSKNKTSDSLEAEINKTLSQITDEIETDEKNYVCRTHTYSSIYSALLAFILDDITIRKQLNLLENLLNNPSVIKKLSGPIMKTGSIFLTTYYRGQSKDFLPLPKALRVDYKAKSFGQRIREYIAEARFGGGLAGIKRNSRLTADQLNAVRQHYGFSTHLLDFSENPEVAAFFSTQDGIPGEKGVMYRYIVAHSYILHLMSLYVLSLNEDWSKSAGKRMQKIAATGLKALKIISVDEVERINRQQGVFINAKDTWAANNFFQPVYFYHHKNELYQNEQAGITKQNLLPKDDPIGEIAEPILDWLYRKKK